MWLGGEEVMLAALLVGRGDGFEFVLEFRLMGGGCGSESQDRSLTVENRATEQR
jgi:hypothetical protein